jgi:hypothetical protein
MLYGRYQFLPKMEMVNGQKELHLKLASFVDDVS